LFHYVLLRKNDLNTNKSLLYTLFGITDDLKDTKNTDKYEYFSLGRREDWEDKFEKLLIKTENPGGL